MLSATELRIGNCVKDHTGAIRFISHRKLSDIASNPDNHGYEPIPLTSEILEACGFRKDTWGLWIQEGWALDEVNGEFQYPLKNSYVGLKYLHQLQNLYYALTGSELTVNLKEKV